MVFFDQIMHHSTGNYQFAFFFFFFFFKTRAGHSLYLPEGTVDPIWQAHICPSPHRARTHDRRIRRPTL